VENPKHRKNKKEASSFLLMNMLYHHQIRILSVVVSYPEKSIEKIRVFPQIPHYQVQVVLSKPGQQFWNTKSKGNVEVEEEFD
jgi:hypothetical protein